DEIPLSGIGPPDQPDSQNDHVLLVGVDLVEDVAQVRERIVVANRNQHITRTSMDRLESNVGFKGQPQLIQRPYGTVGLSLVYPLGNRENGVENGCERQA